MNSGDLSISDSRTIFFPLELYSYTYHPLCRIASNRWQLTDFYNIILLASYSSSMLTPTAVNCFRTWFRFVHLCCISFLVVTVIRCDISELRKRLQDGSCRRLILLWWMYFTHSEIWSVSIGQLINWDWLKMATRERLAGKIFGESEAQHITD